MAIVTKTQLEHAAVDAFSIEQFANGADDLNGTGIVTSRLGQSYKTISKIVADAETAIGQIETSAQSSADAAAASAADAVASLSGLLAQIQVLQADLLVLSRLTSPPELVYAQIILDGAASELIYGRLVLDGAVEVTQPLYVIAVIDGTEQPSNLTANVLQEV